MYASIIIVDHSGSLYSLYFDLTLHFQTLKHIRGGAKRVARALLCPSSPSPRPGPLDPGLLIPCISDQRRERKLTAKLSVQNVPLPLLTSTPQDHWAVNVDCNHSDIIQTGSANCFFTMKARYGGPGLPHSIFKRHSLLEQTPFLLEKVCSFQNRVCCFQKKACLFQKKSVLLAEESVLVQEESVLFKHRTCVAALGHRTLPCTVKARRLRGSREKLLR